MRDVNFLVHYPTCDATKGGKVKEHCEANLQVATLHYAGVIKL